MKNIKKLLQLLSFRERRQAFLLLILIFIMALLDMLGVASIFPFMTVLTNPELIETNLILKTIYQYSKIFGVENKQQFLTYIGIFMFMMIVISLAFKAITTYAIISFVRIREYTIGKRLVEGYLHQPYSWFLSRNSAEIGKTILSEVGQVIGFGILPLMELIAKSMITIAIIFLLILVDPKLALIVGFTLGLAYLIIYYLIRSYLNLIGNKRLKNNELRFVAVSEAFGATKEVKVSGLEQAYIDRFSESAYIFAKTTASSQIIAQLPRYILEGIAIGGVILIMLYRMSQTGDFNTIIPIFSLYIFAGYRLMPALQQIYASFTNLAFVGPSLDKISNDIKNLKKYNLSENKEVVSLNKTISLKNITYNYPNVSRPALKNINLNIPAKSTIGLVGTTGSGKTTMVDIILGLLEVEKGTLEVDGKIINFKNNRSWQSSIGYVPQHIYLADDSIAANIAFGVPIENINQEKIEKVSKISNLHKFVNEELPKKYQTKIGERGVRLSGGQRQRIGIARALYHNPEVLILDEATSALDNQTEKAVMEAVNNLSKNITIILIAHRLNTVKNCDIIFQLENGQVIGKGSYEELINNDGNFSKN